MSKKKCYLEFEVAGRWAGRVEIELFDDTAPRTVENFRLFCTGERGPKMHYASSPVHRIIRNFMIQMGDVVKGDGTGSTSIYGPTFADEGFLRSHDAFSVSSANAGPDTNGSQFFITVKACPHLDGKHVVFGRVTSGRDVVEALSKVATHNDRPKMTVNIAASGQVGDVNDPAVSVQPTVVNEQKEELKVVDNEVEPENDEEEVSDDDENEEEPEDMSTMSDREKRLFRLRLKVNKGRKLNRVAVQEKKKNRKKKVEEVPDRGEQWAKELEDRGLAPSKGILLTTADDILRREDNRRRKQRRIDALGFNSREDKEKRGYDARIAKLPTGTDNDGTVLYGEAPVAASTAALERMVADLNDHHTSASRRRPVNPAADVDFINERNRRFNKQLKTAYDKFTVDIQHSLERGTAL